MGQRLNIEIEAGDKTIANAYYHERACTTNALQLVNVMFDYVYRTRDTYQNEQEFALRLLEATGAKLTEEEHTYATTLSLKTKPFIQPAVNRNDGLIALSENGMHETRKSEDLRVRVKIDIENRSLAVAFNDAFDVIYLKDYKKWLENEGLEYDENANLYDETMIDAFTKDDYMDIDTFQSVYAVFQSFISECEIFYANKYKTIIAMIM